MKESSKWKHQNSIHGPECEGIEESEQAKKLESYKTDCMLVDLLEACENTEFVERETERVIEVLLKNFDVDNFAAYLGLVMGLETWLQRQVQLPGSAT